MGINRISRGMLQDQTAREVSMYGLADFIPFASVDSGYS